MSPTLPSFTPWFFRYLCSPLSLSGVFGFWRRNILTGPTNYPFSWSKFHFPIIHTSQSGRPRHSSSSLVCPTRPRCPCISRLSIAILSRCTHPVLLRVQSCMSGRLDFLFVLIVLLLVFGFIIYHLSGSMCCCSRLPAQSSSDIHTHVHVCTLYSTCFMCFSRNKGHQLSLCLFWRFLMSGLARICFSFSCFWHRIHDFVKGVALAVTSAKHSQAINRSCVMPCTITNAFMTAFLFALFGFGRGQGQVKIVPQLSIYYFGLFFLLGWGIWHIMYLFTVLYQIGIQIEAQAYLHTIMRYRQYLSSLHYT